MGWRDADLRPLSAPGRWRRVWPFLAVTALGLAVAWVPPAIDSGAIIVTCALLAAVALAVVFVPWRRLPARCEALPALALFVMIAVLRAGGDGTHSGYAPLAMLPMLWLALYHDRVMLRTGVALLGVVFLAPLPAGAPTAQTDWRRGLLTLAVAVVVSTVVYERVRLSREGSREASRERDFTNAILDAAGFLVIVLDLDGRIVAFNRRCEQLTGHRAEDVVGNLFWTAGIAADETDRVREAFARLKPEALPDSYESDWHGTDGRRHRILWSNTTLGDEHGRVTHFIAAGRDVTEQRHTLRLFADVLAAATEQAIIATDRAGVVTVFNAGAEGLLGYRASEVVGSATLDAFHHPVELAERATEIGVPAGVEVLRRLAGDGAAEPREWRYVRKDGTEVPVSLTVGVIRGEAGDITGYLSVARDVTQEQRTVEAMRQALDRERDASARLRELDQVRRDLVATVSHELRTPLTSILGNVELLVEGDAGPVPAQQARLLSAVERNARRLLALIEDLLMLSRIEAGAVKINARPVLMRAVVANALETLQSARGTRGVRLSVALPDEPVIVLGDRAQLERVVINLVDNAVKFTPADGEVELRIDCDDEQVRMTVADTGIGIPRDEIDQIFDRFFRSSRSHERQSQGSGLGLAITKSIVERHGGRIWASPAPGTGTVVTCVLPKPRT